MLCSYGGILCDDIGLVGCCVFMYWLVGRFSLVWLFFVVSILGIVVCFIFVCCLMVCVGCLCCVFMLVFLVLEYEVGVEECCLV